MQKYVILIKITPVLYFFCPFSVLYVDDSVRDFFGGDAFEDDDEEDYYIASSVHWIVIVIIKSSSS